MDSKITLKDLEQKMQDGSTLFDSLVEDNNDVIVALYVDPTYHNNTRVAPSLESLATLAERGAKPANIYKVLNLHSLSADAHRAGHIGYLLALHRNSAMLLKYIVLLKKFFTDGVLTDEQLLNIIAISATINGKKITMAEQVIFYNDETVVKKFLNLLKLTRNQCKDLLNILDGISLSQRKPALSDWQTERLFKKLHIGSLFDSLQKSQLAGKDLPKYVTHQAALLKYAMGLPEKDRVKALRGFFTGAQLHSLFMISTDKKANSIKREHGFLFEALRVYSHLGSSADAEDADLCFELAKKLNTLINNKRSRSAIVLKVLIRLLTKSILLNLDEHDPYHDPYRLERAWDLLMPEYDSGEYIPDTQVTWYECAHVTLRLLIVNANSPTVTGEYLHLLCVLFEQGMEPAKILRIIENPMQHLLYGKEPTLTDLVVRHDEGVLFLKNKLTCLLAACHRKDERTAYRVSDIMRQPILSIGWFYSSYTSRTLLNASGFGSVKDALDYALSKETTEPVQPQSLSLALHPILGVGGSQQQSAKEAQQPTASIQTTQILSRLNVTPQPEQDFAPAAQYAPPNPLNTLEFNSLIRQAPSVLPQQPQQRQPSAEPERKRQEAPAGMY